MKLYSSKLLYCLLFFFILTFIFPQTPANAADNGMKWLQTGIRVWYVGGVNSQKTNTPGINIEEAFLVNKVSGKTANVIDCTAADNWSDYQNKQTIVCPDAANEGPFWISAKRLKNLRKGGNLAWLGKTYMVLDRQTYKYDKNKQPYGGLPFQNMLPVTGLFESSPGSKRDIVVLTTRQTTLGKNGKVYTDFAGRFYFDVGTGLMLSKTLGIEAGTDSTAIVTLSEINYDFSTGKAYAEDTGPHSGIANHTMMSLTSGLNDLSGYDLFSQCVSRYNNIFCFANSGVLSKNGYTVPIPASLVFYDMKKSQVYQQEATATGYGPLKSIGKYFYWWVAPSALKSGSLNVWEVNLSQKSVSGDSTIFSSSSAPADFGWTSVTYNRMGYMTDMTLVCKSMYINIDSRIAKMNSLSGSRIDVLGLNYYLNSMGKAVPNGKPIQ